MAGYQVDDRDGAGWFTLKPTGRATPDKVKKRVSEDTLKKGGLKTGSYLRAQVNVLEWNGDVAVKVEKV